MLNRLKLGSSARVPSGDSEDVPSPTPLSRSCSSSAPSGAADPFPERPQSHTFTGKTIHRPRTCIACRNPMRPLTAVLMCTRCGGAVHNATSCVSIVTGATCTAKSKEEPSKSKTPPVQMEECVSKTERVPTPAIRSSGSDTGGTPIILKKMGRHKKCTGIVQADTLRLIHDTKLAAEIAFQEVTSLGFTDKDLHIRILCGSNSNFTLIANTQSDYEYWKKTLKMACDPSGCLTGLSLEQIVVQQREQGLLQAHINIPYEVTELLGILYMHSEVEGLFRLSGGASDIVRARRLLALRQPIPSQTDPHTLSNVLKVFLRSLPEPILTHDLGTKLLTVLEGGQNQVPVIVSRMRSIFELLPTANAETLMGLLLYWHMLCSHSASNRMTPSCLAIVIGPCLLWNPTEDSEPGGGSTAWSAINAACGYLRRTSALAEFLVIHSPELYDTTAQFQQPESDMVHLGALVRNNAIADMMQSSTLRVLHRKTHLNATEGDSSSVPTSPPPNVDSESPAKSASASALEDKADTEDKDDAEDIAKQMLEATEQLTSMTKALIYDVPITAPHDLQYEKISTRATELMSKYSSGASTLGTPQCMSIMQLMVPIVAVFHGITEPEQISELMVVPFTVSTQRTGSVSVSHEHLSNWMYSIYSQLQISALLEGAF